MLQRLALVAAVVAGVSTAHAAALIPTAVDRFFVAPDQSATLQWRITSGELAEPIEYVIRDYQGETVRSGRTKEPDGRTIQMAVKLPRGFFDVEFPATKQRFGIVSAAAYQGKADPFFCIDSAMSWLVHEDTVREGLIRALDRSGIRMSRERFRFSTVSPGQGKWNWDGSDRYETLRQAHAKQGVEVLEMFHDAPQWLGHVGKYPDDLVKTAEAWQQIGPRWQATWGALEVWNEPDIHFGAFLPADQYVPLVQTIAWSCWQAKVDRPLVAGVVAHYNRTYLDNAALNGMLGWIDAFSFHTYDRAPHMEDRVAGYRSWLKAHDREGMPLWLTECGRPWKRGANRPPADEGAQSALDITMKGVEARACGVTRYFPFVLPYYEERTHNFGMVGRQATPLRPIAAYARLTSLLAGKNYLGDLRCEQETIRRARVFADDQETVAVFYMEQINAEASLSIPLTAKRIEGIDGRPLESGPDGTIPIPDGLVYVWLDRDALTEHLLTDTRAMRLSSAARQPVPKRPAVSPIVLRLQENPDLLRPTSNGYQVSAKSAERLPLRVRVFNLAKVEHRMMMTLRVPGGRVLGDEHSRQVTVPAEGSRDVDWEVDLSKALATDKPATIRVHVAGETINRPAPLYLDVTFAEE